MYGLHFFLTYHSAPTFYFCQLAHPATLVGNPVAGFARDEFKQSMFERLAKKPWIAEHRASCSFVANGQAKRLLQSFQNLVSLAVG